MTFEKFCGNRITLTANEVVELIIDSIDVSELGYPETAILRIHRLAASRIRPGSCPGCATCRSLEGGKK